MGPAGKELGLFPGSRASGSDDEAHECAAMSAGQARRRARQHLTAEGADDELREGRSRRPADADPRAAARDPAGVRRYRELHDAALAAGALDVRTKELIALAIAVSKECDGCIAAHAHAAVLHGATVAEAAEAIGVTFLMNGGPATVYGARAFAAFQEFHREYAGQRTESLPAR